jgi:nuclear pore complex protein Nup98-Nup96
LRLEDYAQGRKYGNNNGQAGGFGASTGFGGTSAFGASNNNTQSTGTGFGATNNTATANTGFGGFGANTANNTATSGFGNSGGSLFGQNKPAGSVFGQSTTTPAAGGFGATNTASTGGFGASGGFGGGFGASNNTATPSLFGSNNNNAAAQPASGLGGFGANNTNTGGFGNTNNTTTSLFGNNNNAAAPTTTSLFGNNNNNQQQQPASGFGANTGSSLFGNQNKPATGLFGNTTNNTATAGTSLFGANTQQQQQQQAQPSGGLFGAGAATTGGLFGNNQQQNKPAGSLFGSSTTATGGGGLFGNNNAQPQQQGSSLFGNTNNNNGGSLFGQQQNKPAGGLFGNTNNTATANGGSSLFGNNQQQQPNNGSSLFGNSMTQSTQNQQNNSSLFGLGQSGNQTPQSNQLHASLTIAPYGNEQLFGSLGASATPVGPLATPLTGAKPAQSKTPSLLSSSRLNSPVYTPRGSFSRGGTYSYATPSSSFSSSLTPGASSLLKPSGSIGSNLSSRLAKSISMQNLRGDSSTPREGESLLRPVPGSASSRFLATGSMRKLNIDRSLRIDLFSPPSESRSHDSSDSSLKKKVSFDNSAAKETPEPSASNALVRTEDADEDQPTPTLFRAAAKPRPQTNGAPEMQQTNGSASLAPVQEGVQTSRASTPRHSSSADNADAVEIGEYWSKPSIKELKSMSRAQLSQVSKFVVGRAGTGRIEFSTCDLTDTELDDIPGRIVKLEYRSATVYPTTIVKPPRGKGLNVPSTIYLENVLPKNPSNRKAIMIGKQPNLDRFVQTLKSVTNTTLKSFDEKTGFWIFTVEHFTTYGFEEDDDTEVTASNLQQESSLLSDVPATPSGEDEIMQSIDAGAGSADLDDTFEFKIRRRPQAPGPRVPGNFDEEDDVDVEYEYDDPPSDDVMDEQDGTMADGFDEDPFMVQAGGAVRQPSPGAYERYEQSMLAESGPIDEAIEEMPGSFGETQPKGLRSILKPTAAPLSAFASPEKLVAESWEDQLQRTISPQKRDRQKLRDGQPDLLAGDAFGQSTFKQSLFEQSYLGQKSAQRMASKPIDDIKLGHSQAFRNSMDLINSLWADNSTSNARTTAAAKGLEV